MWEPATVAVMHCRGHQWSDPPQAKGSCLADRAAKQAATQDNIATRLMVTPVVSGLLTAQVAPVYDKEKKPPGHELSKEHYRRMDGGNSQMGGSLSLLGWHFNWFQTSISPPI